MDESHEVSVPTPQGTLVPDWWARAYGPTTMYVTTLDASKPESRAVLLAALNGDVIGIASYLNTEIEIVGYTLTPAHKEADGEVVEWVRCVLHLADGKNVAAGSMGIIKSLLLISQLDRKPPWNPPLRKRVVNLKTSKGHNWYALTDAPPAKTAGKPAK